MHTLLAIALALAVLGCGARKQSSDTAADGPTGAATGSPATGSSPQGVGAVAASQPNEITELTNQVIVYECPNCGMMYDGPGKCSMDQAELVPTRVSYICPADNRPVEHAGKCPRCAQNARVVKTVMGPEGLKVTPVGN